MLILYVLGLHPIIMHLYSFSFLFRLFPIYFLNNKKAQSKMQEQTPALAYLHKMKSKITIIYTIGLVTALIHLVGIIWQSTPLVDSEEATLNYMWIGGYLIILAIAFAMIIVYFIRISKQESKLPKNLRRFFVTLSLILFIAQTAITIIMCIRVNDYRIRKDTLSNQKYAAVIVFTIIDILLSLVTTFLFLLLLIINIKTVSLSAEELPLNNPGLPQSNREVVVIGQDRGGVYVDGGGTGGEAIASHDQLEEQKKEEDLVLQRKSVSQPGIEEGEVGLGRENRRREATWAGYIRKQPQINPIYQP